MKKFSEGTGIGSKQSSFNRSSEIDLVHDDVPVYAYGQTDQDFIHAMANDMNLQELFNFDSM
jgi:hypothetical protein